MADMPSFAKILNHKTGFSPTSLHSDKMTRIEVIGNNDNTYILNEKEEIIFLLEKRIEHISAPWILYQEYNKKFYDGIYPFTRIYRNRIFYENLLIKNGCYISHVSNNRSEGFTFGKMIIRRIISLQEWGNDPTSKRKFHYTGEEFSSRHMAEYGYFDYINAFRTVPLYENLEHTHFWSFTISPEVNKKEIPSWFVKWWKHFGSGEDILPEPIKKKFSDWIIAFSPSILKYQDKDTKPKELLSLHFFAEFSIPYLWRWKPEIGMVQTYGNFSPCLIRQSYSKFDGLTNDIHQTGPNPMSTIFRLLNKEDDLGESSKANDKM